MITLRDYQEQTITAIEDRLAEHPSTIAVLATGLGKTVIACELMRRRAVDGKRSLFLAHRKELIDQTAATVERLTGITPEVEMAAQRGITSGEHTLFTRPPIAVASKDTLVRRLKKIGPASFDLVIIDECHRAEAATYRAAIGHFAAAKVVGITATPMRGDGKPLRAFSSVASKISIVDGTLAGWLVPIDYHPHVVGSLDLSGIAIDAKSKDYAVGELADRILSDDVMREAVAAIAAHSAGRRALIFTPSVAVAYAVASALRHYGIAAEAADGETGADLREDMVRRFRAGELQAMCNCALWTEGFDAPICDLVVLLSPTQSIGRYLQMIGRGTRPLPGVVDGPETADARAAAIAASAKPILRVLDLMGNAHDQAMSAVDLFDAFAERRLDDGERKALAEHSSEPTDWEERPGDATADELRQEDRADHALGKFRAMLERRAAEQAAEAERKRKKAEAAERRAQLPAGAAKGREALARDMRALGLVIEPSAPAGGLIGDREVEQVRRDAGNSKHAAWLTRDEAVALRRLAALRRRQGCCTHAQALVLARAGVADAGWVSYDSARAAIDALAASGWKDHTAAQRLAQHVRTEAGVRG